MTLSTTESNQKFVGDGVITEFEVTYKVLVDTDLKVYLDTLLQDTGYTVVLNIDQGSTPGASVTFDDAPALGVTINVLRKVPVTQEVDYQPYDAFPAETHEGALDSLTMQTQQLTEEINRAYKAPIDSEPDFEFDFPPYDAGKLLGWSDTETNKVANAPYSFQDIIDEADKALVSASGAAASELKAGEWAAQQEDIPVEGQLYSARHYSIKALKARSGLNLIAIISGDDLCPKPGDDPGDCTAPDHRNPSERFPNRDNLPGDYFIISVPGSMNLKDPQNPVGPNVVTLVEVSDYIIYFPEVQDGDGNTILGEGWYRQGGLTGDGTSAVLVSFNDSNTVAKGTNVQIFNEQLDVIVNANRLEIIVNQESIDVNTGRLDGLDAKQITQDAAIGANATAAAGANTNANTRKLQTDFLRTGTRLDITNVPVA